MVSKLFKKIKNRKSITSIILLLILIVSIGYWSFKKIFSEDDVVRYEIAQVQKGTLIVSVSGTGQVSASNQVDVKSKTSGDVVYVGVKNGQEVKAGTLIVQLDARDAQKAVRDAQINFESAKLALEKLKQPADTLSILQAENALAQAKQSKQKAEDDLEKAYEDGFNTIANAFLDLPEVMTGLEDIFFDDTIDPGLSGKNNIAWYVNQTDYQTGAREKAIRYENDFYAAYNSARIVYIKNFDNYKAASRKSSAQTIETLITETYDTTKIIADAIKISNNFIDFVQDDMEKNNRNVPKMVSVHQSNLDSYTAKTNSHLLALLNIKTKIQASKDGIINADRLIAEKTESLAKLKAGKDALDIQSAELVVKQRENALLDAKERLNDYFIRAPFDGIIAKINVKKADPVSSGLVLVTLITKQKLAEISLNEIDVAQVKVGQKATLTFDAVSDLAITGQVAEVDTVGTISQGVVTYNIKITFDTQDERVKPTMTVSADIITDIKTNVLLVPNSAVKSENDVQYVEVVEEKDLNTALATNQNGVVLKNAPRRQIIEVGLVNDEFTEIVNGLKEGDFIVIRTIQPNLTQPQKQQQTSGLRRIPGFGGR